MQPIKVVYIVLRFPSISETFIAEEMQKIRDQGVDIAVFSLLSSTEKIVHPVSQSLLPFTRYAPGILSPRLWFSQIHVLARNPSLYFKLLKILFAQPAPEIGDRFKRLLAFLKSAWIARQLEGSQTQMIHAHFAWLPAASAWAIAQWLNIPYTVTTHAFDIYSHKNDLLPLTTQQAARVITISEMNKQAMLRMDPTLEAGKIHVIHCGVDLAFFEGNKTDHSEPAQPIQITSVGSLIEKKGHEYLIRACHELKELGYNFNCVVIGDGELHQSLNALIRKLDLQDQVTLAGKKPQGWVRDRLGHSDLFVLACVNAGDNDRDGIPVAMMEALAMKIPVITTPVSGIPELIKNDDTGLMVPERDPGGITQAIIHVANDATLRNRLAQHGRDFVEREFNITTNVVSLKNIFAEVISQHEASFSGELAKSIFEDHA